MLHNFNGETCSEKVSLCAVQHLRILQFLIIKGEHAFAVLHFVLNSSF